MKEFLTFMHLMNAAACNLMLIPVVSWLKGISLEDAYYNWKWHFIIKKFL